MAEHCIVNNKMQTSPTSFPPSYTGLFYSDNDYGLRWDVDYTWHILGGYPYLINENLNTQILYGYLRNFVDHPFAAVPIIRPYACSIEQMLEGRIEKLEDLNKYPIPGCRNHSSFEFCKIKFIWQN